MNRITLRMEGTAPGEPNVRLSDFIQELSALRSALRKTEETIAGRSVLDWQIVDLTHSSPATVSIEPVLAAEDDSERPAQVVGRFFGYLTALQANEAPAELDRPALEAFRDLVTPVQQKRIRAEITTNGDTRTTIQVLSGVETTIEAVLAPTMRSVAAIKGRLEFLNIHDEQNVFRVYSDVLPRFVVCHFPDTELSLAKGAIGLKVRVTGEATYESRDAYPRSIEVTTVEVLPEDDQLPRLLELRGVDPNATGDLSSEDYVRALRGEE